MVTNDPKEWMPIIISRYVLFVYINISIKRICFNSEDNSHHSYDFAQNEPDDFNSIFCLVLNILSYVPSFIESDVNLNLYNPQSPSLSLTKLRTRMVQNKFNQIESGKRAFIRHYYRWFTHLDIHSNYIAIISPWKVTPRGR